MQQVNSKRAGDGGIDCLAEQYAEILRLRMQVRRAELAAKQRVQSADRPKHASFD